MASSARLLPLTLLLLVMLVYGNQADVSVKSWISRTVCKDLQSNCNQIKSHCESQPVVQKQCPETCGLCPEICKDLQSNCNQIKSHCESQPLVQKQCPETCGLCPEICKDLQSNCIQIKSHCESQPVVQKQCPETCGLCPEITTAAPRATTAIPDSGSNSKNCGDSSSNCASLAAKGKCRKGKIFEKCRSSCPCGTNSNQPCEDTKSKCSKWATQGKCSKAGVYKKCRSACRCDPETTTTPFLTTEPTTTEPAETTTIITTTSAKTTNPTTTTPELAKTTAITTAAATTTRRPATTTPELAKTTTITTTAAATSTKPKTTTPELAKTTASTTKAATTTTRPKPTTPELAKTTTLTTTAATITKSTTTTPELAKTTTITTTAAATTTTTTTKPTPPTKTTTTSRPSGWQPKICDRYLRMDNFMEETKDDIEFIPGLPFSDEEIRTALLNHTIQNKPSDATYTAHLPKKIPSIRGVFNTNWPNAEIPYEIHQYVSHESRQNIIRAMEEIVNKTCLRFPPREEHHTYWLEIGPTPEERCYVDCKGIDKWNAPPCKIKLHPTCSQAGIVHEFLHIAGLVHEHQRKDRDDFVTINWENIQAKDYKQFCKLNTRDTGFPYDYESIMHYGSSSGAKEIGLITIMRIDGHGHELGMGKTMTQGDVNQINYNYCDLTQVCETGWKEIDSSNKKYCFAKNAGRMNYWNAQAYCQRFGRGAQLAILDTEAKRNDVAEYMKDNDMWWAWVGAYVIDGDFTWLNGKPITEGWFNETLPEPATGFCVEMGRQLAPNQLDPYPCNEAGRYLYQICEI